MLVLYVVGVLNLDLFDPSPQVTINYLASQMKESHSCIRHLVNRFFFKLVDRIFKIVLNRAAGY